jgi:hypothetical protein
MKEIILNQGVARRTVFRQAKEQDRQDKEKIKIPILSILFLVYPHSLPLKSFL